MNRTTNFERKNCRKFIYNHCNRDEMIEEEERRKSRRYEFDAFETMIDAVINFETLFTSFSLVGK